MYNFTPLNKTLDEQLKIVADLETQTHDPWFGHILKDGERMRVEMSMIDGLPPLPKIDVPSKPKIDSADKPQIEKLADGLPVAGHRNGWRLDGKAVTDSGHAARQKLYEDYDKTISTMYLQDDAPAWKGGQPRGKVGSACVVRGEKWPLDQGAPGTLDENGDCVPNNPRGSSDAKTVSDAEKLARLYQARDQELENAWRGK
jgi:hypothetical protein